MKNTIILIAVLLVSVNCFGQNNQYSSSNERRTISALQYGACAFVDYVAMASFVIEAMNDPKNGLEKKTTLYMARMFLSNANNHKIFYGNIPVPNSVLLEYHKINNYLTNQGYPPQEPNLVHKNEVNWITYGEYQNFIFQGYVSDAQGVSGFAKYFDKETVYRISRYWLELAKDHYATIDFSMCSAIETQLINENVDRYNKINNELIQNGF